MRTCVALLAIVIALGLTTTVHAGKVFYDDFEDGSATDGSPVTWVPVPGWSGGTREVIDGSFVHSPAGSEPVAHEMDTEVLGEDYDDVSIRSQISPPSSSWVYLYARSTFVDRGVPTNFQVYGSVQNPGRDSRNIVLGYANNDGANQLATTSIPVADPLADLHMQFDVFGDSMQLTVWPDGEAKPPAPQLTHDISQLTDALGNSVTHGAIGMFVVPFTGGTSASFRDFEVVPEPSALATALLSTFGLFTAWRWRRR